MWLIGMDGGMWLKGMDGYDFMLSMGRDAHLHRVRHARLIRSQAISGVEMKHALDSFLE